MKVKYQKIIILVLVLAISGITLFIFSNHEKTFKETVEYKIKDAVVLYLNSQNAYINGELVQVDSKDKEVKPISKDGRTMLPVRFVSEFFGADIDWNEKTRKVDIKLNNKNIEITLDENSMLVDGKSINLEVPATSMNGRTMLPLRALTDVIDKKIFYSSGLIIISDNEKIFDVEKDKDEIEYVTSLVKMFPRVNNEENFGKIMLKQDKSEYTLRENYDEKYELKNISYNKKKNDVDIVQNDGKNIYRLSDKDIYIVSINKQKQIAKLSYTSEFKPENLLLSGDFLAVIGKNDKSTEADIYDVSNPKKPNKVRNIQLDGDFIDAKIIDSVFYLITNKSRYLYEQDKTLSYKDDKISKKQQNVAYKDISYIEDSNDTSFTLVGGVDLKNLNSDMTVTTHIGFEKIYVSDENVYVSTIRGNNDEYFTDIYKFNLKFGKLNYSSKTTVDGKIINRNSMEEYDGNFRITTISGNIVEKNGIRPISTVYTMNTNLRQPICLSGIAPGSIITDVKYSENKAYLFTDEKELTAYVVSFENTNPIVLGVLVLENSDYIYPYSDNFILTFSKNNDDNNNEDVFGLEMEVYNVSDPNSPKFISKEFLGDYGSDSKIFTDYRALFTSEDLQTLVIPLSSYMDNKLIFQGAYIYTIDEEQNIKFEKEITHYNEGDYALTDEETLNNKILDRIVIADDKIYSLSNQILKICDIYTYETEGEIIFK